MNKKIIASLSEAIKDYNWKFPFSREDVKRIRISAESGIVRWYVPDDLYADMPQEMHLSYTNIYGMWLIVSSCDEDLILLHKIFVGTSRRFIRLVFPNTDDRVTVKKRFRKGLVGFLMKVWRGNLALRQYMDGYENTVESPSQPKILFGRFLVIKGKR